MTKLKKSHVLLWSTCLGGCNISGLITLLSHWFTHTWAIWRLHKRWFSAGLDIFQKLNRSHNSLIIGPNKNQDRGPGSLKIPQSQAREAGQNLLKLICNQVSTVFTHPGTAKTMFLFYFFGKAKTLIRSHSICLDCEPPYHKL